MKITYSQAFMDDMRALAANERRIVLATMREIEKDPWSKRPGRWKLPPMWRAGTFAQKVGDYAVSYCQDGDDALRFLHIRLGKQPGFDSM